MNWRVGGRRNLTRGIGNGIDHGSPVAGLLIHVQLRISGGSDTLQDGLYELQGIISSILAPATDKRLMDMGLVTSSLKKIGHLS